MKNRKRNDYPFGQIPWMVPLVCFTLALAAACFLAPVLPLTDPNLVDMTEKFGAMSLDHPLGTDYMGRDLLSRVLWGGRTTLSYTLMVTVLSAVFGTGMGIVSGFAGGVPDSLIMKLGDILRAFPGVIPVLIAVSVLGSGIDNVCLALMLTRWIWYCRMARNLTKREMGRTAIIASRLGGSSWFKILRRHILGAVWPQMLPVLSLDFGSTLLAVSGYSFLGLGVLPPEAEWGMMINDGRSFMSRPAMMLWPGLCVVLTVICVHAVGDRMRDRLEEKQT